MRLIGPTLQTERLILRPVEAQDFDAWAGFCADAETMEFLGGVQPRAVAWRGFLSSAGAWVIQGFSMFSVVERSSGAWVGRVGTIHPEGWPGTEVGWGIVRERWGRGYAGEAAMAAMDWAADHLGWSEIIHTIANDNHASCRVATKLGSTILRRGTLPPPINEELDVWGQTADQWRARRL